MASSKGGAKKFYHTTSQQAYYMRPSEAKVVSLEGARPVDDAQKVRLGIVSMTKRPADLEQWLAYHRRVVGVEKLAYTRDPCGTRAAAGAALACSQAT